jgi:hypothetical protein
MGIKRFTTPCIINCLVHCRLTNIPSEYYICDLFAKLVAETRN